MIKLLKHIQPDEQVLIGTKAQNLKILLDKEFRIPKSLVITNNTNILRKEKEILEKIKYLESDKLVVRSSANFEDLKTTSFAGLFKSFLNVTKDTLLSSIKKCKETNKDKTIDYYCQIKNIDPKKLKINIIVQEMIPCKFSGVSFSKDPITKEDDIILIELSEKKEGITAGNSKSYTIKFDKKNKKIIESNLKKSIDLKTLTDEIIRIEKIFNNPIDVEWGFDGKNFWFFQVREI